MHDGVRVNAYFVHEGIFPLGASSTKNTFNVNSTRMDDKKEEKIESCNSSRMTKRDRYTPKKLRQVRSDQSKIPHDLNPAPGSSLACPPIRHSQKRRTPPLMRASIYKTSTITYRITTEKQSRSTVIHIQCSSRSPAHARISAVFLSCCSASFQSRLSMASRAKGKRVPSGPEMMCLNWSRPGS